MARKQTTIVRCDRHGCKEVAEVLDTNEAAPGWLSVYTEKNFKYVGRNEAKEFCSEKCVAIWARDRAKYQKDSPTVSSLPLSGVNGDQEDTHSNDQKIELERNSPLRDADEIRGQILEALNIDVGAFVTANDVAGATDMNSSTARRYLNEMAEQDTVEIQEQMSQRGRPMRLYRLK